MDEVTYTRVQPPNGVLVETLPGLMWLRVALPFALDHVNLWLLDDGDGWTAIDTGVADAATREIWSGLIAAGIRGRPLRRLLVTHFHPDHAGLAGWLVERTGIPLLMSRTEWLSARWLSIDETPSFDSANAAYYRLNGLDEAMATELLGRGNAYRRRVSVPPGSFEAVAAGDRLRLGGGDWQVIVGEGHAPEQVTLWSAERNLLIAADQILPRISPVVGAWASQPAADPLGDFLASLDRYADMPDDAMVLPSHGLPFTGLHERRQSLRRHHDERLAHVVEMCCEPATTAKVAAGLFRRPLDLHQMGFALAETLAHLNRLEAVGAVERGVENGAWSWQSR